MNNYLFVQKSPASSGNRTRAARVAGEHSTTEPTMLQWKESKFCQSIQIWPYATKKFSKSHLLNGKNYSNPEYLAITYQKNLAVGRIRTYAPRGKLISSQSP